LAQGSIQFQDQELSFEEETSIPSKKKNKAKPKPAPPAPKAKLAIPVDTTPSAASTSVEAPTAFVPRAAKSKPRAGVGLKSALQKGASSASGPSARTDVVEKLDGAAGGKTGKDQDAFRKMLGNA